MGAAWAMLSELSTAPVDCVCMCHDEIYVGDGFHGMQICLRGAAGANVTDATGAVDLAAGVVGKGVDVMSVVLPVNVLH